MATSTSGQLQPVVEAAVADVGRLLVEHRGPRVTELLLAAGPTLEAVGLRRCLGHVGHVVGWGWEPEHLPPEPAEDDVVGGPGSMQASIGRYDEAAVSLEKACRADSSHEEVWYNLGQVYYSLGRYSQSADALHNATRLNPQDADAWMMLGIAQNQRGKFDEALQSFKSAALLQPQNIDAKYCIGLTLVAQNNYQEALRAFRGCLRDG